jgi:hypothetical protein
MSEKLILKWISKEFGARFGIGLIWLKTETSGRLVYARYCIFRFYKMKGIS